MQPFPNHSTPQMHPLFGLAGWSSRILWYTGLEAILELSWDALHVTHTSGAGGLPPLGLLAPVVYDSMLAKPFFARVWKTIHRYDPEITYIAVF